MLHPVCQARYKFSSNHKARAGFREYSKIFLANKDLGKLQKEAKSEVAGLEDELKRLERLKGEAGKRKEDAKLRELERERLLKEAELKKSYASPISFLTPKFNKLKKKILS